MLKVEIRTEHGALILIDHASTVVYIKTCPYQGHEFRTVKSDQVYCCENHRNAHWKKLHKD